ncbi:hypothetical protein MELA_00975 [Candidatus Methylomirabilis lanthanidiphila]|uniref:Uncharacterized protein n=1 Tax=Candidatus Methylomirabilis lanthanidiphila TaxID=2211376 RepID=A0A564ZIY2_9BACT|nr:hypothetical protein [Candidatus Methylomirabilis lanthanidiphila]VUZ84602.1 hypothetical protein MELA_00975 [Candidatus Methylomirabilis lanthanidiphila]
MTVDRLRVQRIKALAIVLVLSLVAFETARYSAHHLSHLNQPIRCAVATASAHLAGIAVTSAAVEQPALLYEIISEARSINPSTPCFGPATGRAPPPFTA